MRFNEFKESKQPLTEEGFWSALRMLGRGAMSGPGLAAQVALSPTMAGDGTLHSWHVIPQDINPEAYNAFADAFDAGNFGTAIVNAREAMGGELTDEVVQLLTNDISQKAAQLGRDIPFDSIANLFRRQNVDPGILQAIRRQAMNADAQLQQVAQGTENLVQDPSPLQGLVSTAKDIPQRLEQATGGRISGDTAIKVASAIKKYALPAAAVLALLYGGSKLYKYLKKNKKAAA
jgi:hypothetical protein